MDFTPDEKIAAFDRLHASALRHLREVQRERYADDDAEHYMFEDVMNLLGPGVWDEYNRCLE